MPKLNSYLIENKKPVETVAELKNETPSFEEFMKTYEADEKVNYYDLIYSDISDKGKGHGPCTWDNPNCSCCQTELQRKYWVAINNSNTNIQINITNI